MARESPATQTVWPLRTAYLGGMLASASGRSRPVAAGRIALCAGRVPTVGLTRRAPLLEDVHGGSNRTSANSEKYEIAHQ
jgi:hypothetical protein